MFLRGLNIISTIAQIVTYIPYCLTDAYQMTIGIFEWKYNIFKLLLYTGWPKNGTLFCTPYKFIKYWPTSNFFHCQNQEKICNNTIINRSHHTSNVTLHYLVKCQCLKATIENKYSVTTHFKKLTTGNNVFICSVIV